MKKLGRLQNEPPSQVHDVTIKAEADITLTHRAFLVGYERDFEITSSLINFGNKCAKLWESSEYYSPYAAVVNASMTGKSRAFCQLPCHGLFVITGYRLK